ncbi:hypothetical protein MMC13_001089 [Lambiella insularis]|nr:hypothetical protein [Lambiella insularis]
MYVCYQLEKKSDHVVGWPMNVWLVEAYYMNLGFICFERDHIVADFNDPDALYQIFITSTNVDATSYEQSAISILISPKRDRSPDRTLSELELEQRLLNVEMTSVYRIDHQQDIYRFSMGETRISNTK